MAMAVSGINMQSKLMRMVFLFMFVLVFSS